MEEVDGRALEQKIAAGQLVDTYGLSEADAAAQVDQQERQAKVAQGLAATVDRKVWAGSYIDHRNGGVLVVQVTDAKAVQPVEGVRTEVKVVERSLAELQRVEASLERDIAQAGLADDVDVYPNIEANVVTVEPRGEKGAAGRSTLERLAAAYGKAAALSENKAAVVTGSCDGSYQYCDAPLRGGIVARELESGSWLSSSSLCTMGFIVRSNTDAIAYVLTAGHCLENTGANDWATKQDWDEPAKHVIGTRRANYTFGTATGDTTDYGLINIANRPGWDAHPWVLVRDSSWTVGDGAYEMTGVGTSGSLPNNYLMCRTGAATKTLCGEFDGTGHNGAGGVTNLGRLDNTLGCQGDSGGPFYKSGLGYGIYHGQAMEATTIITPGVGPAYTAYCGSQIYYQGLTAALSGLNVYLDT